jgi:hypothetical protein
MFVLLISEVMQVAGTYTVLKEIASVTWIAV